MVVLLIFRKLLAVMLSVTMLFGGYLPAVKAHESAVWAYWTDELDPYFSFGANSAITIHTGKMQIIPACSEGTSDGLTSWTDLYIVPSGSITEFSNGEELKDVSGGAPNSVMSLSSGIFISETIGYTGPDGKIPPGKYAIVFDECQDGKYNVLTDSVIDPAFEVNYTVGYVPPLDLTQMKEDADKLAKRWEKYKKYTEKLFKLAKSADAHNPNEKMVDFLMRSGLQDPREASIIQLANQAKHYEGIAADPPDPNFQHITPLGGRQPLDFQSNDSLDLAIQALANEAANEQSVTQQLWTLLEKYQGAQAAGSVNWALTHAKALNSNVDMLLAQLQRTNQSLNRLNQALVADARPFTQLAADMEQLRSRIASTGLTTDEIRYLLGLGFSDAQIAQFQTDFVAQDFTFTKNDMLLEGSGLIDDNNVLGQYLASGSGFGSHIVSIINTLLQDPTVSDHDPVAEAGGPYSGSEGTPITFNGSASTSSAGIAKYEWDLDLDGNFNDAAGASVSHTYTHPFRGLIGLKVTDGAGYEAVDYAEVNVTNVNQPPVITASTPANRYVELHAGETASFAITASDPESDPISTEWYIDGVSSGTGTSFTYSPVLANAGIHHIEAVVSDASPLGGSVLTGWSVQVLKPIPASIALSPVSASPRVGTTHSLQAIVLDDQGHAVAGLPVSLAITGANPATLSAVTDGSGHAAFSYAASNAGDDQATAQAALLTSNTVGIHWTAADTTAPVTSASLSPAVPDGANGAYASPVTVTLSAEDSDSGVAKTEYQINGGVWKTYSGPFSIGVDGDYTVQYRSTDNAGNEETAHALQFKISLPVVIPDTAAPVTTATTNPAGANGQHGWYVTPVTITLMATDNQSGVAATQLSLDGAAWVDYASPVVVSGDGGHTIQFKSTDYAGNTEVVQTASFQIDASKPASSSSAAPSAPDGTNGWYVNPVTVTLTSEDITSGIDKTEYRTNGGSWTNYTAPIAFTSDGQYTFDWHAVDLAGNASDNQTLSLKLDRTKPVTTASLSPAAPDGSGGSYASDVTVTLTSTDGGSGVAKTEYRLDGGAWQMYGGTPVVVSNAGAHQLEYRSTDLAGNTSDVQSVSFTIDKSTPPQVFFNPQTSGRNVALLESGASVVATSGSYDGNHTPQAMLDYSAAPYYPWATKGLTGQYVKVALAGSKAYLIDKVQLMPRIDYGTQRVKDFEIAVSTTTTDDAAFKTVLTAQAANDGTLQEFQLPQPVMAKYLMYRPLTRQGNDGCNCISTQQLKVNTGQEGGAVVHFQNLSTVDAGSSIVSWSWNFGDGQTSTEESPTHTYSAPGTYNVTLNATDSSGKTGTFSLEQTVLSVPAVNFTFTPGTSNEGQSVTFTDTTAVMTGSHIVQRTWTWGDGTSPDKRDGSPGAASIAHTFRDNGNFNVTLEVFDDKGQVAQLQKTVTVNNLPPNVTVTSKQWVKSGQSVSFAPTITDAGQDRYSCLWNFGDGTTSGLCTVTHTYPSLASGEPDKAYFGTLTVTDKDGASTVVNADVTVYTPYINSGTAVNNGDLYYSRFCASPNVRKLVFNYDGTSGFTLSAPSTVTTVGYADGLIFAPDGDLLAGGGSYVYKVNRETGTSVKQPSNGVAYHLMLDKSGKKLWAANIPGALIEFSLDPEFGPGKVHPITGDDTAVTSVAFDTNGNAFYTSSGSGGYGNFGTIDLTTFKTTRLLSSVAAAHGLFYDHYTGHLIMDGSKQILQFDPVARKVVSIYTSPENVTFDQGAADGKGHILVASNSGHLLFIDYSASKEVGSPHNFVSTPYVETCLDDVAPLSGFGTVPPAAIGLTPASAELTIGDTHNLTALVTDANGNTMAGYPINLTVTGANAQVLTAISDASGKAAFSYKGTQAGDDKAVATAGSISSAQATVKWSTPVAAIELSPSTADRNVGETHQLTARVTDASGAGKAGVPVNLTVTGVTYAELTGVTDLNGNASFSYTGTKPGIDTVIAKAGSLTSPSATVKWSASLAAIELSPATAERVVGETHQFTATVTDTLGAGKAGVEVSLTVTGATYATLTGITDSTGKVIFSYTGTNPGTDTAIATAGAVGLASSPATVNWKSGNVDTIAPATLYHFDPIFAVNSSGKQYIKGFKTTLRATDPDPGSGVKATYYRINSGEWILYTGPFEIYAGTDHLVEYYSIDQAGNIESPMNVMDFVKGTFTGAGRF